MKSLSHEYSIKLLCQMTGVSRAGYYKWLGRGPSPSAIRRREILDAVEKVHQEHPTHGYRWIAAFLRLNRGIDVCDNYVFKCCKCLGIKSQGRQARPPRPKSKAAREYPNLIFSTWDTVDRPRQVIVSDMTAFRFSVFYIEVTFYFDVFTKEILTFRIADRRGSRFQYLDGLKDVISLLGREHEPVILHTDRGSVYASMAYGELVRQANITRSMSRPGKPTDNPVNESLNGWIKEELLTDFHIDRLRNEYDIARAFGQYVEYWNTQRPCYAIAYHTPKQYFDLYRQGKLKKENRFENRVLTTTPKFVLKRKQKAENQKNKDKNI